MDSTRTADPRADQVFRAPPYRSAAGALIDVLRVHLGFTIYGLLALVVLPILWLVAIPVRDPLRRKHLCQRIVHLFVRFWMFLVTRVIGIFRVDFPEHAAVREMRGTIIAPSHPSLVDALHFLARMPWLTCLMKKSILKNPFMGRSTRLAGYLPNDHGREFVRLGRDALRAGDNLLIFPEGTRTTELPVNTFKKGFALVATLAEAPVQTVFITMPYFFAGKRWKFWRAPRCPVPVTVRLGRRFVPQPGQSAQALGAEIEAYFRAELPARQAEAEEKDEG